MPAPNPEKGENQRDYLKRCVPFFINEGRDQKQAVAICSSIFNRSKRKSDLMSEAEWDYLK